MQYNPLVEHAFNNVWCSPPQDNPTYFTLHKLSPINGWFNYFKLHSETLTLPVRNLKSRYACYQIGQVHPELLSLLPIKHRWVRFDEVINKNYLMADLYNQVGLVVPKTRSWYRWTRTKNLIILAEYLDTVPIDFNNDTICLRMNSNEFFHSNLKDASGVVDYMQCTGGRMDVLKDIDKLIVAYNTAVQTRGAAVR